VVDLGSGDGRIVIAAATQHQARGLGIDYDPTLIAESRANAAAQRRLAPSGCTSRRHPSR